MPIKFLASRNTIIFGPTGIGKTQFMLEVIRQQLVEPFPENIYYMYNIEQDFMKKWNEDEKQKINFIKGLDFDKMDTSKPSLLVVDDLILSGKNNDMAEIFILGSHHKQISVFYITQNLFPNCPLFRLMSSNSHYFVLFNSQRHYRQINTLAHQMFCGQDLKRITNAYIRSSKQARGFILLSLAPEIPKELTVITDYWEWFPSVYL